MSAHTASQSGGVGPCDACGPMTPGAVRHHHRDGDVLLAGLAELGPVPGDRGVQVELAAVGQQVHAGARQSLGAGEDAGQGVFAPGLRAVRRRQATPQVDDELAFHPDRHGGTDLAAVGEVGLEGVADPLESGLAGTVDGGWELAGLPGCAAHETLLEPRSAGRRLWAAS